MQINNLNRIKFTVKNQIIESHLEAGIYFEQFMFINC